MVKYSCKFKKLGIGKVFFSAILLVMLYCQPIGAQSYTASFKKIESFLKAKQFEQAYAFANSEISSHSKPLKSNKLDAAIKQIALFSRYYRYKDEESLLFSLRKYLVEESELKEFYLLIAVNQFRQNKYSPCLIYLDSLTFQNNYQNNAETQNKVLGYKTTIYSDLGLFIVSNELGIKALDLFKQREDSLGYFNLTQTLAYNDVQLGNYEQALRLFNESVAYYKRTNQKGNLINNYLNVGDLFWTMNRVTDAERSFLLALDLAKTLNKLDYQILSFRYLGLVTQSDGDLKKAKYYLSQAENLAKENQLNDEQSKIKHTLMLVEVAAKNWVEAGKLITWLDSTNTENIPELTIPKSTRIRYLISQNKIKEAKDELEIDEKESNYPLNPIHQKWFRIWISGLQNPDEAAELLNDILNNDNAQKNDALGNDYHKALMSALNSGLLKQAVEPLFDTGQHKELLFKVNEFVKGVLLSNRLDKNTQHSSHASDSLSQLARQMQEQISLMKLSKKPIAVIQSSEQKLTTIYEDLERINKTSSTENQISLLTLKEAQNELKENQLFVHVLETDQSYQVLLLTNEKSLQVSLKNKEEIQEQVQLLIDNCKNPKEKWNTQLSENLLELLFPSTFIDISRLTEITISADGIWTAFPFETLMKSGKYLGETHAFRYISSFAVASRLSTLRNASKSDEVLVFSNPEFPESSSWKSLAFTTLEAKSIQKNAEHVRVFAGSEATAINFKKEIEKSDYAIIHIATHGLTDRTPDKNRLIFSYADEESKAYFFPHSLSSNSIKAKLVVLSACETAVGQYISGEGLWGMQRSWINAGAESVLAGLWQVNDKSTALFMDSFYRNLKENETWLKRTIMDFFSSEMSFSERAKAVSEAKKSMIKNREFSHPYYWAGLMYFGL